MSDLSNLPEVKELDSLSHVSHVSLALSCLSLMSLMSLSCQPLLDAAGEHGVVGVPLNVLHSGVNAHRHGATSVQRLQPEGVAPVELQTGRRGRRERNEDGFSVDTDVVTPRGCRCDTEVQMVCSLPPGSSFLRCPRSCRRIQSGCLEKRKRDVQVQHLKAGCCQVFISIYN